MQLYFEGTDLYTSLRPPILEITYDTSSGRYVELMTLMDVVIVLSAVPHSSLCK